MDTIPLPSDQKYVFISFGGPTPNYHFRVNEICTQMKQTFPNFVTIEFTEHDLKNDTAFWSQHGSFLMNHKRGYGYWLWKPYIIQQTLQTLQENDILIYVDAGCTINPKGFDRFQEYLHLLNVSPFGMLAFQLPPDLREINYTKRILLDNMKTPIEDMKTGQFMATVVMLRKTPSTMAFTKEWYSIASIYENIDDTKYVSKPEYNLFRDHRHDQSIYSLLVKQALRNHLTNVNEYAPVILKDETDFFPNWYKGEHFPIWATRIR